MNKYYKEKFNVGRSKVVQVIEFIPNNFKYIVKFLKNPFNDCILIYEKDKTGKTILRTQYFSILAMEGDYLIKNEDGDLFVCNPDIFNKKYEECDDDYIPHKFLDIDIFSLICPSNICKENSYMEFYDSDKDLDDKTDTYLRNFMERAGSYIFRKLFEKKKLHPTNELNCLVKVNAYVITQEELTLLLERAYALGKKRER